MHFGEARHNPYFSLTNSILAGGYDLTLALLLQSLVEQQKLNASATTQTQNNSAAAFLNSLSALTATNGAGNNGMATAAGPFGAVKQAMLPKMEVNGNGRLHPHHHLPTQQAIKQESDANSVRRVMETSKFLQFFVKYFSIMFF